MKKRVLLAGTLAVFCVSGLYGCAGISEGVRGFAGVSTKVLEEGRSDAVTKAFAMDYAACYNKTEKILKRVNSYVYARTPGMLAVYLSDTDTTPVGIFFKNLGEKSVLIEVSSPSTHAKELLAKTLFEAMEKPLEELGKSKKEAGK